MHDTLRVNYLQALNNCSADAPDLLLFYYPRLPLSLLNIMRQQVPLGRILHHKIVIPISMLVFLEKAPIQLNEMCARQLLQELSFFHGLLSHGLADIFSQVYPFQSNFDGHVAGPSQFRIDKFDQINAAKSAFAQQF